MAGKKQRRRKKSGSSDDDESSSFFDPKEETEVIPSSKISVKRSPSRDSTVSAVYGQLERASNPDPGENTGPTTALFHASCIIIECSKHNKIAMETVSSEKKGLFFPFKIVYKSSFQEAAQNKCKDFLNHSKGGYISFSDLIPIHTLKIEIPSLLEAIERATYYTRLNDTQFCCMNSNQTWVDKTNLLNKTANQSDFWGHEQFSLIDSQNLSVRQDLDVHSEAGKLYSTKEIPSSPVHILTKSMNLSKNDIIRLYWDFIQECYPSSGMTVTSFNHWAVKTGALSKDKTSAFFRAFNLEPQTKSYLTFKEFLMGFIITDKKLPSNSQLEQIRAQYMINYYATERSKGLTRQELEKLLKDTGANPFSLTGQLIDENGFLPPLNFKNALESKTIKGSSSLMRSSFDSKGSKLVFPPFNEVSVSSLDKVMGRATRTEVIKCLKCEAKKYAVSSHSIRIDSKGYLIESQDLDSKLPDQAKLKSKVTRSASKTVFLSKYVPHMTIRLIQDFADVKGILKGASRSPNPKDYLKESGVKEWLPKLCDLIQEAFKKQSRLLTVSSPAMVFGDIHGNLKDLLVYEKIYWPSGPTLNPCQFVFLGDYVDRGEYSLEVVLYLFSSMLVAPQQFFLLRGNHETAVINRGFTFYTELQTKLGQSFGAKMFERLNQVFDHMPLAAAIDGSIFCCHGGVPCNESNPTKAVTLNDIANIPSPLNATDTSNSLAWQLIWNDPVEDQELKGQRIRTGSPMNQELFRNGFTPNMKRGTAYSFSMTATDNFMKENALTHIIRAHECNPEGFDFKHKGRTITVFSSSEYNPGTKAAVLMVHGNKIRPVGVDTKL